MEQKADHILDFRGSISSIALLKTTQIFDRMNPFEIMEILGSDPDMRQDLFRVLPTASYDVILNDDTIEDDRPVYRLQLRKCRQRGGHPKPKT